ncbi:MAG: TIR domain-containing protein [Paracoccaceae bacterium]
MTKAFISYHHRNDQGYRDHISSLANVYGAFDDCSVELDDIDDGLAPQTIRRIIRDDYLRDTQVTILLCGTETKFRKHVDWELKSSMIDGTVNRRSGILVIDLPTTSCNSWQTSLRGEKDTIYPDHTTGWFDVETKADFESRYPDLPERIVDNLVKSDVALSVVPWLRIENQPDKLKFLVDATARVAASNEYDCSLPMRMRDYYPRP